MAKKSYGIENLSYRDSEREDSYNLERVQGPATFNFPANMNECTYAYPSDLVEFICTDSLQEREKDTYSPAEVDLKFEDLRMDMAQYIKDATVSTVSQSSEETAEKAEALNIGGLVFTKVDSF